MPLPLVPAAALLAEIGDPRLVLLDVRHRVGSPRRRADYDAGHLPDAVYVELRDDLAGDGGAGRGRNPLPEPDDLESSLRSWGVREGSRVVVYADAGAPSVGRAWWVLTWAGVEDVRILDGGLPAWVAAGGAISTTEPVPGEGDVVVRPGALGAVAVHDVAAFADAGQLVDARERADYLGDPSDARTGHIPGAVNIPYLDLLASDGTVDQDAVVSRFAAHGVDLTRPVALTCGGGVAAAFAAALLEGEGVPTLLHVGSWSEWVADPARPREVTAHE